MVLGMGLPEAQVQVLLPLPRQHAVNVQAVQDALRHPGPSVLVFRRECIQSLRRGVLKDHDRDEKARLEQACCTLEVQP